MNVQTDGNLAGVADRIGVPSWWNLSSFYKSEIGNFVVLDNMATLNVIPRRFFTLNSRLENYSHIFIAFDHVPICYDVATRIKQRPRPKSFLSDD